MGKFPQFLTELSARDTIMAGYYSLMFLLSLKEWIHFQGRQLCQSCFCLPTLTGKNFRIGKNLISLGVISFLSEFRYFPFRVRPLFRRDLVYKKANRKSQSSYAKSFPRVSSPCNPILENILTHVYLIPRSGLQQTV